MSQSTNGRGQEDSTRRDFLKRAALAAATMPMMGAELQRAMAADTPTEQPAKRPNILLVISDQYRWDFVCGYGHNPMNFTPNLDGMLRRGTAFENAFTNQPLCSPARACLFTGQYATKNGVWTLVGPSFVPGLAPNANTLATELHNAGYSTNYIGKWHLAPRHPSSRPCAWRGYVPPEFRGGFKDLWQADNVMEVCTTFPYHGTLWDGDGNAINYKDIYRVDFLTDLAVKFLKQKQEKPFFLVLSQLEPHQQNELNGFAPPKGYEEKFRNPYVPPDLRPFPGDWPYQLGNYYGDCKSIDESMGKIFKTLKEQNLDENTIVVFLSDHGCHFRTRNDEYKRSPQDASTHIPLLIQGPGFDHNRRVSEMVNIVDLAPSLLAAAGVQAPASMQGQNFVPLINDAQARAAWRNEVFIQISQSEQGRAIRTPDWTYVAIAPEANLGRDATSVQYQDYQLYNNAADPAQIVNLAGRSDSPGLVHYVGDHSIRDITDHLRERLIARMVEAGEPKPEIKRWPFYA